MRAKKERCKNKKRGMQGVCHIDVGREVGEDGGRVGREENTGVLHGIQERPHIEEVALPCV